MGSVRTPERVAVIGAGMVGLSTAWFLQEHGAEVAVLDKGAAGAAASWGNAGWLTPGLATPLPEPAVLRYGLRTALRPSSPLYVAPGSLLATLPFLLRFAAHCTAARWSRAMESMVPINGLSLDSFDILIDGGTGATTEPAEPFLVAYRTPRERTILLDELTEIRASGQDVTVEVLSGDEARELEPSLSGEVGAALRLHDQRFIHPGNFVGALARAVSHRGGKLLEGTEVTAVRERGRTVVLETSTGPQEFDAVVLAVGTWMNRLTRGLGVRTPVHPGRGYSFSIPIEHVPTGPVYFAAQRVACTPLGDRLRVAGMMEFRPAEAPLDPRRIAALANAARPLLQGADFDQREDEWVGSRPVTADGLPVIGATRSERVFMAGGHGMWGITLGPATARLLAAQIMTGEKPAALLPFDPLR